MTTATFMTWRWSKALKHPSVYFGLSSAALIWTGAFLLIDTEHRADEAAIRLETAKLARVIEESVIRAVGEADAAIRLVRLTYEQDGASRSWPELLRRVRAAHRSITGLTLLDQGGDVIASDDGHSTSRAGGVPAREQSMAHAADAAETLRVSAPVVAPGTGRPVMQVSRRLLDREARPAGAVAASLDLALLSGYLDTRLLGNGGAVTVVGKDGIVRASAGHAAGRIGAGLSSEELRAALKDASEGSLRLAATQTGRARVASFRWVRGYPLAVVVAMDENRTDRPLLRWRSRYLWAAAALSLVVALIVSLGLRRTRRLAEARQALAAKSNELEITLENMTQGIMMIDGDDRICVVNGRCIEMLGLPRHLAAVGGSYRSVTEYLVSRGEFGGSPDSRLIDFLRVPGQSQWVDRYERVRPDGTVLEVRNKRLADGGFIRTLTDITDRRRAEERIVHLARHDGLTGISNRESFRQRLEGAVAALGGDTGFALLMIDLDRFKAVNDTYGHLAGDRVLREMAARFRASVREHDIVARLGGDEFAIIQLDVHRRDQATSLADRICKAAAAPFTIDDKDVHVGASVGIALAPQDGPRCDELIQAADLALYSAKAAGRNSYQCYAHEMHAVRRARSALEADLRIAVRERQFVLHYQPIYSIATGTAAAFEALIRWQHPERGMVPPMEFIPLAEESGLIGPIGAWVLESACREIAQLSGTARVAVNLSPVQFRDPGMVDVVRAALKQAGLAPNRLEIEITESVLLQSDQQTLRHLEELRALGVHITMDDFGTGYSSLGYLLSYPIQSLKIDRSFVKALGEKASSGAIVRAITSLASSLGLSTTAEGVETSEQLALLSEAGCTEAQGYYLGRPAPLTSFTLRQAERALALDGADRKEGQAA